jgi:threonine synthase
LARRDRAAAKLGDGLWLEALSNGPTLAFKDMAMQLLGNLFEYELARRGEELNILGATSGDTGSAAEYAMRGKKGVRVFMTSPHGRMSPFQQAQMFSLQDANIHNIAIEGVFDDCQDIVKAVSNDLAFKRSTRLARSTPSTGRAWWPRWCTTLRATCRPPTDNTQKVSFTVPSGNFGNVCAGHVARMHGPAHRATGGGHQRKRRAGRVLPHRRLPRARQRRHARDLQPVDGHLQGQQLRALRVRPAGP